jgi:hypothetical protein
VHMPTAKEVYAETIRDLPSSERLRLATLILEDLAESAAPALDYSDAWTEEDLQDLVAFSERNAGWKQGDDDLAKSG